ncbi:hypothetical protein ABZ605_33285 [Streptomyces sp. NPDC012765]|uniref:hypothetical protein n=1 Tax=Streptomyces sp. NPDC012765 TaxID=3155249 RepID=UPI00340F315A
MVKKSMTAGAVAAAALAAVITAPGTANAVDVSENRNYLSQSACSGTEFKFTFRFNSNQQGAYRKLGYAHGNLAASQVFAFEDPTNYPLRYCDGTGNGSGQGIKNNAASIHNSHTSYGAVVYYNSWWQGASDGLQPGVPTPVSRNLSNTYNQNASFKWS